MPLPDAWEQVEYWNEWPPEHVLLRGFTGYEPAKVADMSELTAMLGPAQQPPAYIKDLVAWADETSKSLGIKHGQS